MVNLTATSVKAKQIYELFEKTDSDPVKRKLANRLVREPYWERIPYTLMLYSYGDENIQSLIRPGLYWKHTYAYSGTSKANAAWILEILDDDKYQISDKVKEHIRFNLEHAVKK